MHKPFQTFIPCLSSIDLLSYLSFATKKDGSHQRQTTFHQNKDFSDIFMHTSNRLLFDDITVYLNLIGVQDSLHAESAQPRNCTRRFSTVVGAAGDKTRLNHALEYGL